MRRLLELLSTAFFVAATSCGSDASTGGAPDIAGHQQTGGAPQDATAAANAGTNDVEEESSGSSTSAENGGAPGDAHSSEGGGATRDGGTAGEAHSSEAGGAAGSLGAGENAGGSAGERGGAAADYAGVWAGVTSQNLPIQFVIDGTGLAELEYGWSLPLCSSETRVTLAAPAPIVGTSVSYELRAPAGMSTTIHVELDSEREAHGQLEYMLKPPPGPPSPVPMCSGTQSVTFTAQRTP